jgi:hypothetical protein
MPFELIEHVVEVRLNEVLQSAIYTVLSMLEREKNHRFQILAHYVSGTSAGLEIFLGNPLKV